MAHVTGPTVKQVLRELFDYEVSDADAETIARSAGAMQTLAGQLGALALNEVEPPFGYPTLHAEAERLSKIKS
jgi:hypothetical protein